MRYGDFEVFPAFSIRRGVMNRTRDTKLKFVEDIPASARKFGQDVYATLGLSAIGLVHKGLAANIIKQHPDLDVRALKNRLSQMTRQNIGQLGDYKKELGLGAVDIFRPIYEQQWIGAVILDEGQDMLGKERQVIAQLLSDTAEEDIALPEVEFFLNIGIIDVSDERMEGLLDEIAKKLPEAIDVYDVDMSLDLLYTPLPESS